MLVSAGTSSSSATPPAKKAYRQGGQKSCGVVVVFDLQRIPEQDLLNEELLERLRDGNGELADKQRAGSRHLRSVQGGDVAPPHRASSETITSYTPIARTLLMLDEPEGARMRLEFDGCFMMAKEGITFKKSSSLCKLEAHHELELGHDYGTASCAKLFTHYIAHAQRDQFTNQLFPHPLIDLMYELDGSPLSDF